MVKKMGIREIKTKNSVVDEIAMIRSSSSSYYVVTVIVEWAIATTI